MSEFWQILPMIFQPLTVKHPFFGLSFLQVFIGCGIVILSISVIQNFFDGFSTGLGITPLSAGRLEGTRRRKAIEKKRKKSKKSKKGKK